MADPMQLYYAPSSHPYLSVTLADDASHDTQGASQAMLGVMLPIQHVSTQRHAHTNVEVCSTKQQTDQQTGDESSMIREGGSSTTLTRLLIVSDADSTRIEPAVCWNWGIGRGRGACWGSNAPMRPWGRARYMMVGRPLWLPWLGWVSSRGSLWGLEGDGLRQGHSRPCPYT